MEFYSKFKQEDLADLLAAYNNYIGEAALAKVFNTGWTPACVEDFYEREYQSIWKTEHDFSKYFYDACDMAAKEVTARGLAFAIDEFYYVFDTYNYKDEVDDREEAVAGLENDILSGKIDDLKNHLKNEMLAYGETDCFSLAANLLIAQMEQYQKQQEQTCELLPNKNPDTHPDRIEISCYADQVLPWTDRSELVESYQSAQFTVPRAWADAQAKGMGFDGLEDFLDSYTWDHTDGWYEQAFRDGVLLDVRLTQGREVVNPFLPDSSDITLDEKLSQAKEAVQNEQPQYPPRDSSKSL